MQFLVTVSIVQHFETTLPSAVERMVRKHQASG
jgi:hypothetical protein